MSRLGLLKTLSSELKRVYEVSRTEYNGTSRRDSVLLILTAVAMETLLGYPSCFHLSWTADRWRQLWALDVSLRGTEALLCESLYDVPVRSVTVRACFSPMLFKA